MLFDPKRALTKLTAPRFPFVIVLKNCYFPEQVNIEYRTTNRRSSEETRNYNLQEGVNDFFVRLRNSGCAFVDGSECKLFLDNS